VIVETILLLSLVAVATIPALYALQYGIKEMACNDLFGAGAAGAQVSGFNPFNSQTAWNGTQCFFHGGSLPIPVRAF
jgi:hypothetical protein